MQNLHEKAIRWQILLSFRVWTLLLSRMCNQNGYLGN